MIFTSTRNPRRVSEAIYSFELIPRAIYTSFEIDTRSHKQSQRCSEIDSRSPSNSNWCLWNQHTISRRIWDALIPIVARALGNNLSEESTKRRLMQLEMYPTRQEQRII